MIQAIDIYEQLGMMNSQLKVLREAVLGDVPPPSAEKHVWMQQGYLAANLEDSVTAVQSAMVGVELRYQLGDDMPPDDPPPKGGIRRVK